MSLICVLTSCDGWVEMTSRKQGEMQEIVYETVPVIMVHGGLAVCGRQWPWISCSFYRKE
jgi:hypothetical protein